VTTLSVPPAAGDPKSRARTVLKTQSVFAACPDPVIDEIMRHAKHSKVSKGQPVCRQNEPGDSMMVVLSGSFKVTTVTTEAKEVVLNFLKSGAMIGEIACFDGGERTANVIALESCEIVSFYRRDLLPILHKSPEAMMALIEGLTGRLRNMISLVDSYSLETSARVASSLVRLAEEHGQSGRQGTTIDVKLSQSDLGSHLGLTRETVSRTLGKFRDLGLADTRGMSIIVLDLDGLRDIAEGGEAGQG
jgi:CRP/FNR family transcriptional regulator, cyclic AMP receptor protein